MREHYLLNWECFCMHSFAHPEIYKLLFFRPISVAKLPETFKAYYEIFPKEKSDNAAEYEEMLMEGDFYRRDCISFERILKEQKCSISKEDAGSIIEMNILIYRGMLTKIMDDCNECSITEAIRKTVCYIDHTLHSYHID